MKHLLLLGGGHAHVHVLKSLAEQPVANLRVTLVSPFDAQIYSGMVPGWVAGHYQLEQCSIALDALARAAGAEFVRAAASGLDAPARRVVLGSQHLAYDLLSIDIGSSMEREQIPGARQHALFVRPMEHFVRLFPSLPPLAAKQRMNVVVLGGGAAGVELAMAVHHRLGEHARTSVVTGGGPPCANAPEGVRQRVQRALKRRNIAVFDDTCSEISAAQVRLASGTRLACDAPLVATGGSAARWLADSGLALDAHGYIVTTPTLQARSHPEVFAAGDIASRDDVQHPRSGVYAVRAGPPLAHNLRQFLASAPLAPYAPRKHSLNLLSCGARYAIGSWGALSFEGAWVWRWKDHIDRGWVARYDRGGAAVATADPAGETLQQPAQIDAHTGQARDR